MMKHLCTKIQFYACYMVRYEHNWTDLCCWFHDLLYFCWMKIRIVPWSLSKLWQLSIWQGDIRLVVGFFIAQAQSMGLLYRIHLEVLSPYLESPHKAKITWAILIPSWEAKVTSHHDPVRCWWSQQTSLSAANLKLLALSLWLFRLRQ